MKKIIIFISLVFALFTLASCTPNTSESSITSTETLTSTESSSEPYGNVTHDSYEDFINGDDGNFYTLIGSVKARTDFNATKFIDTRYVVEGDMPSAIIDVEGNDFSIFNLEMNEIDDLYINNGAVIQVSGIKGESFGDPVLNSAKLIKILETSTVYNEKAIDKSAMTDKITISGEDGTFHNDTATYSGELSDTDIVVTRDEFYTDYLHVALYIYVFEHLPFNYHMKEDFYYTPTGKDIIGGNCFNENPNPSKPVSGQFTECDVDNFKASRGETRIVFSRDMEKRYIYHTVDHYTTYTLITFDK